MEKIAIGLSGGADSAFAAYLLLKQGYKLHAFTMQFADAPASVKAFKVAEKLGIELEIMQLDNEFSESIIEPFIDSYAAGYTPSPCVLCNRDFKFGLMLKTALANGCSKLATGHYARIKKDSDNGISLLRGIDTLKEQSYFLAQLSHEQLSKALFPLGEWHKKDVLKEAIKLELISEEEGESQDLCFLPDGDFVSLLLKKYPDLQKEGWIIDSKGKKLGKHQGAFQYTKGQRKGLGLGGGPWFVIDVNTTENLIVVGKQEDVEDKKITLSSINWLQEKTAINEAVDCEVQVRYRMKARKAKLYAQENDRATLVFEEKVSAAAPGQLAVCYNDEKVIAAGWIEK